MTIDKLKPVLVTGASGYVAGWIVKRLLEEGLVVHAAVRDPSNEDKIGHLVKMAKESPGTLKFFKADLLEEFSYAEAMQDCQIVFHTASPFIIDVKDPKKDLVDPAQKGTANVLMEACRTPSVRRLVLTSSVAAMYGDCADLKGLPEATLTEEVWNKTSTLNHQPYSYSKTLAEQEAWKIFNEQTQWELIGLNPSLVIGPGTNPLATSESFSLVKQLGDGTMKSGVPDYSIGIVDVRDLAEAHFRAAFLNNIKGRFIISAHNTNFFSLAQALIPKYGDQYPIPRRVLPKFLIWIFGPILNKALTRKSVQLNVGIAWRASNRKSRNSLGMIYRPMEESINDFFEQLVAHGLIGGK